MAWKRFYRETATHSCSPETTILDAMARMDRVTPYLFQIVVTPDGKVLGTVTDGDIRRALLRGEVVSSPVTHAMKFDPIIAVDGNEADIEQKIVQMSSLRTGNVFMPLVDAEEQLVRILVLEPADFDQPAVLVMAGGQGKRLGERTRTTPKPLLDVGGRPMLDYVLERVEAAGIKRIFVSVNYLAEKIRDYIARRQSGCVIEIVAESKELGTAGAIGLLPAMGNGPLLVLNGDVLSDVNLQGMLDFHQRHELEATVGAAHYRHEVPFGIIRHDEHGAFEGISEKPSHHYYVSAGINVLSPSMRGLVPRGQHLDMPDLLNSGRAAGFKIGLYPIHEYWTDLGRPTDLETARPSRPSPRVTPVR